MNFLKLHLYERQKALKLNSTKELWVQLNIAIDRMRKNRRATLSEKEYFIHRVQKAQAFLPEDMSQLKKYDFVISDNLLDKMKQLTILTLLDCQEFAYLLQELSMEIENQTPIKFIYIPLGPLVISEWLLAAPLIYILFNMFLKM